jgi:hypothetical protein
MAICVKLRIAKWYLRTRNQCAGAEQNEKNYRKNNTLKHFLTCNRQHLIYTIARI